MTDSRIQPMPAELRRDPPVCCDCDAVLCCDKCGMEQPYTDISILRAKVDELTAALRDVDVVCHNHGKYLAIHMADKIIAIVAKALAVNSQHSDGEAG